MLSIYLSLIKNVSQQNKFENIYRTHQKAMYYVAFRVLGNQEDAEDAVQEALLRIAQNIDRIDDQDDAAVKAFVLTVARNVSINMLRDSRRIKTVDYEGEIPDERQNENESTRDIMEVIKALPILYQEVLMLHIVYEMEYADMAKLLGRPEATLRQQVKRGKNQLATRLKQEGIR